MPNCKSEPNGTGNTLVWNQIRTGSGRMTDPAQREDCTLPVRFRISVGPILVRFPQAPSSWRHRLSSGQSTAPGMHVAVRFRHTLGRLRPTECTTRQTGLYTLDRAPHTQKKRIQKKSWVCGDLYGAPFRPQYVPLKLPLGSALSEKDIINHPWGVNPDLRLLPPPAK